jgi:hypothetical protein
MATGAAPPGTTTNAAPPGTTASAATPDTTTSAALPGMTTGAIALAMGAAPPRVSAAERVDGPVAVASSGPGGGDRHGEDGGSRRGREGELRHGRDDATPTPRRRPGVSRPPRPTHAGSPAAVVPTRPARPVSERNRPDRMRPDRGVSARVAAVAGLGGLLILTALLFAGRRRLARMRSV